MDEGSDDEGEPAIFHMELDDEEPVIEGNGAGEPGGNGAGGPGNNDDWAVNEPGDDWAAGYQAADDNDPRGIQ